MSWRILLCLILVLSAYSRADQPGASVPAVFSADGGASYVRVGYRASGVDEKLEAYGTAYWVKNDGADEVLWHFSGIKTFHPLLVFLSFDATHMVLVAPKVAGRDPKIDDFGIAFYHRGKLLKRYAPLELVVNTERVIRTTGSYFWLARDAGSFSVEKQPRPEAIELGFWPLRSFWLRTVDGILFEFDSYTGEIKKKEPNQSPQPTRQTGG